VGVLAMHDHHPGRIALVVVKASQHRGPVLCGDDPDRAADGLVHA
jgi:hypothetical protein